MGTRPLLALCAAVAASAGGCGGDEPEGGGDRAAVERTVTRYLEALARGDGAEACGHLTAAMQERLTEQFAATSCEDGVEKVAAVEPDAEELVADAAVEPVTVDGDRATVRVAPGQGREASGKATLERTADGWKIADISAGGPMNVADCVTAGEDAFGRGDVHPYWERRERWQFIRFLQRFCRQLAERYPDGGVPDAAAERLSARVLRDMIRDGELPAP